MATNSFFVFSSPSWVCIENTVLHLCMCILKAKNSFTEYKKLVNRIATLACISIAKNISLLKRIQMVTPQSPTRMFNGLDEDIYNEAKFAHEINDKMRVPKRIKATGEFSDEDLLLSNQNGMINSWNYHDKIDMNVPDRIVVLGHNQHLETRSAPREIQLENSILPKNPSGFVRVQTPPRTITLNEHHFPSASEESSPNKLKNSDDLDDDDFDDDDVERPPPYVRANGISHAVVGFHTNDAHSVESDSQVG